jgi:hypothetical protein
MKRYYLLNIIYILNFYIIYCVTLCTCTSLRYIQRQTGYVIVINNYIFIIYTIYIILYIFKLINLIIYLKICSVFYHYPLVFFIQ